MPRCPPPNPPHHQSQPPSTSNPSNSPHRQRPHPPHHHLLLLLLLPPLLLLLQLPILHAELPPECRLLQPDPRLPRATYPTSQLDCSVQPSLTAPPPASALLDPLAASSTSLTTVNLHTTSIAILTRDAFAGYPPTVLQLLLRQTLLETIHVDALTPFPNLVYLDLNANMRLHWVPPGLLRFQRNSLGSFLLIRGALTTLDPGTFTGLSQLQELTLSRSIFDTLAPEMTAITGPPAQPSPSRLADALFSDLPRMDTFTFSSPLLLESPNAVAWPRAGRADHSPKLRTLNIRALDDSVLLSQFAGLPALAELATIYPSNRTALRRRDFALLRSLERLSFLDSSCAMRVLERDLLLGSPAMKVLDIVTGDCSPPSSRCRGLRPANSTHPTPVLANCTCATGYAGDGSFCEPACPVSAVFTPLSTTSTAAPAPQTADCSTASLWPDALCCAGRSPPQDDRGLHRLPNPAAQCQPTPSQTLLACTPAGRWQAVPIACTSACTQCTTEEDEDELLGSYLSISGCAATLDIVPSLPYTPLAIDLSLTSLRWLREGAIHDKVLILKLDGLPLDELAPSMFCAASGLVQMTLRDNPGLTMIPPGVFAGLTSLDMLRLSGSAISTLHAGVLAGLAKLTDITANLDFLTTVEPGALVTGPSPTLKSLRINARPGFTTTDLDLELTDLLALTNLSRLFLSSRSTLISRWEKHYPLHELAKTEPFFANLLKLSISPRSDTYFHRLFPNLEELFFETGQLTMLTTHSLAPLTKLTRLEISFNARLAWIAPHTLSALPALNESNVVFTPSSCTLSEFGVSPLRCTCASGYRPAASDPNSCLPACDPAALPPDIHGCASSTPVDGDVCPPPPAEGWAAWLASNPAAAHVPFPTYAICDGLPIVANEPSKVPRWVPLVLACVAASGSGIGPVCICSPGRIDCTSRNLSVVPPDLTPALRSLILNQNALRLYANSFDGATELSTLLLNRCSLSYLPAGVFSNLTKLNTLEINNNQLTELPGDLFAGLSRLRTLRLNGNRLTEIPIGTFGSLPSLHRLNINEQTTLGPFVAGLTADYGFPVLDTLDITNMGLSKIPPFVSHIANLEILELTGNPFSVFTRSNFSAWPKLWRISMSLLPGQETSGIYLAPDTFADLRNLTDFVAVNTLFLCGLSGKAPPEHVTCVCQNTSTQQVVPASDAGGCMMLCPPLRAAEDSSSILCPPGREGDYCEVPCRDVGGVPVAVYACSLGAWRRRSYSCLSDLSMRTPAPTATPTPAPSLASNPSAPSSSSSSSSAGPLVAAGAAVVALLVLVVAVVVVRRRRRQGHRQHKILGELRELMQIPNMQAREVYAEKFAGILEGGRPVAARDPLGPTSACDQRVAELERRLEKDGFVLSDEVLGAGNFGRVLRGRLGGRPVAVKMLHEGVAGGALCVNLLLEGRVLAMLAHPNLVELVGLQATHAPALLVMEFCNAGDLRALLRRYGQGFAAEGVTRAALAATVPTWRSADGRLTAQVLLGFAQQVAAVMVYLHSRMLIHRDLAARNVLVVDRGGVFTLKLGDLGLMRSLHGEEDYYRKTSADRLPIKWMDPTAVSLKRFTKKSDVWSYGVLVWEMFSFGDAPWERLLATEVVLLTQNGRRLPAPDLCPPWVYQLLLACWHKHEAQRPAFPAICEALQAGEGGWDGKLAAETETEAGAGAGAEAMVAGWGESARAAAGLASPEQTLRLTLGHARRAWAPIAAEVDAAAGGTSNAKSSQSHGAFADGMRSSADIDGDEEDDEETSI